MSTAVVRRPSSTAREMRRCRFARGGSGWGSPAGGRLGFLDRLVGDGMSLRGAAQLAELGSYDRGFGNGSQHADGRFAAFQLAVDPLAIRLIQSQILVVERAQQPAAYQPCG